MSFQLSRMGVIVYDFTAFSTSLGTFIACPQGVNVINILCLYNLVLHLYLCLYCIQDTAVSVYTFIT